MDRVIHLVHLLINLQNDAYARNPRACHFMDPKDVVFSLLHNVLDNFSEWS